MAWVESAPKLRKFGNSRVGSVAPINHQSLVSAVLATWHIQLEKQGAKYDSAPAYVASRQVRGHPLLSATHQAVWKGQFHKNGARTIWGGKEI